MSLNPFGFRASYKLGEPGICAVAKAVSIPLVSGLHTNRRPCADRRPFLRLNPFGFRASYKPGEKTASNRKPSSQSLWFQGFIQTEWGGYMPTGSMSQSLWFQGFIQTHQKIDKPSTSKLSQSLWFQGFIQTPWSWFMSMVLLRLNPFGFRASYKLALLG